MFPLVKKIVSKSGDLHFCRWAILECSWFNIYIHLLCKSDEDKHLHSHPWWFMSMVLLGEYEEQLLTQNEGYDSWKIVKALPFIPRFRRTNQYHKIQLDNPVLSLVITGPKQNWWGYWLSVNRQVDNAEYRVLKEKGLLPI